MTLREIRGRGFYTDENTVYYNETKKAGGRIVEFTPAQHNRKLGYKEIGVSTAYSSANLDTEVRLVAPGETFLNNDITIIDAKTLRVNDVERFNEIFDKAGFTLNFNEIVYSKIVREYSFNNIQYPKIVK